MHHLSAGIRSDAFHLVWPRPSLTSCLLRLQPNNKISCLLETTLASSKKLLNSQDLFPIQNHLLDMDAKHAAAPTWETIRYMVSAIQYGGRITDEYDKLLMDTYAERFFHQVKLCSEGRSLGI